MTRSHPIEMTLRVAFGMIFGSTGGDLAAAESSDPFDAVSLSVSREALPGFDLQSPDATGITFTNRLSDEAAAANQIRLNGSGVALGDVDGDGRVDVFLAALEGPNRLYRNLGDWRFAEVTGDLPISMEGLYSTGVALADVDGDGDLDLLIAALGDGVGLFLNDGRGRFAEKADSGLLRKGGAMTLTLADVDGDGDLDLYVANYRSTTIRTTGFPILNVGGKRTIPPEWRDRIELTADGRVLEHGDPDVLYLNDGGGRFTPVPWSSGRFLGDDGQTLSSAPRDWSLTAVFRDLNLDGAPDLYVCGDFHSPDRMWLNDGQGRFAPAPWNALRHTGTFSMSAEFADLDRDGHDDFVTLDMLDPRRRWRMVQFNAMEPNDTSPGRFDDRPQYGRNMLQANRGDGTFADLAGFAGIEATGWSWSVAAVDVDLDGFEDLLVTTGNLFDPQDVDAAAVIDRSGPLRRDQIPRKLLRFPRLPMAKTAFRNLGGFRFAPAAADWGFDDVGVAHGMALGDLDGDGDLDVVVNNLGKAAGLYRNRAGAARIALELRGLPPNTSGVGARVAVEVGGFRQTAEVAAGGRYLSGDAPGRTFAWPREAAHAEVVVDWPSGRVSRIGDARPNHRYVVRESAALPSASGKREPRRPSPIRRHGPLFDDVSGRLAHRHAEDSFDDFSRQPLLPHRLGQAGPGVAWLDLDDDGWEDLVVGSGRGGRWGIRLNDRRGGFNEASIPGFPDAFERDSMGVILDPLTGRGWITAWSNYEDGLPNRSCLGRFDLRTGAGTATSWDGSAALGCLAATDHDGDGDLDLLAAGGGVPGRYPEPADSVLWRNEAGNLVPDVANGEVLKQVGLVTGALWTDLDGDGFADLVLACAWGPIRVFRNDRGRLRSWDQPVRATMGSGLPSGDLRQWSGWWTTLGGGDFDGDGRGDLVIGNWGLNTSFRATVEHPLRLYYGDFDGNGTLDPLQTYFDRSLAREVPERDLMVLRRAVPGLVARFATHEAYAVAGIEELLGDRFPATPRLEASILASVLLLHRGDHWEARTLPDPAQWSPVMGLAVGDIDGDGDLDLYLAQNFFGVIPTIPRNDAGRGLILRNDGTARFEPVDAAASGVAVYGEQRGCAFGDFDRDGRLDLVVGQNGAETKLFRNRSAQPALRVRVQGRGGNPTGVGVALRWIDEDGRRGPVHEVLAGSGGLSQSSLVTILGTGGRRGTIEARWPGGMTTRTAVESDAREVIVRAAEEVNR